MILLAESEGPDQTARMRTLIWAPRSLIRAFAAGICPKTFLHGAVQIYRVINVFFLLKLNVPQRVKTYLLTNAPNDGSNQLAHPLSDQSLHFPLAETLHPWLSKIRRVKILISLRECAGWSESSLCLRA